MAKDLYKSLYVIAGRRENGSYGIIRYNPSGHVDCFDTSEEAQESMKRSTGVIEKIVVDIGLLVDPDIKRVGNTIDVFGRFDRKKSVEGKIDR